MWEDNKELFQYRKRYYGLWTSILARSDGFLQTRNFSLHKMLIDGLESCT